MNALIHLLSSIPELPEGTPDWTGAFLGFGGALLGAILTYLGVRYAAKLTHAAQIQTAAANKANAAAASHGVEVTEWKEFTASLKGEIARLSEKVEALEADRIEDRARIDSLENDLRKREARHFRLLAYLREVLEWAKWAAPEEKPPTPPATVAEELSTLL